MTRSSHRSLASPSHQAVMMGSLLVLSFAAGGGQPQAAAPAIPCEWSFTRDGLECLPLLEFHSADEASKAAEKNEELDRQLAEQHDRMVDLAEAKKWTEARQIVDELLKNHPRHRLTARTFNDYVSWLSREDTKKKDEVIAASHELMRRFPKYGRSAYRYIQQVTGKQIYFYHHGRTSLEPGQKPVFYLYGRNVEEVALALYKVDLFELIEQGISLQAPTVPKDAQPLKTWRHAVRARQGRHISEKVEMPVSEPGAYLVTMTTEHYQLTTLTIISSLAAVTKSDGRILLACASDMRGGQRPGVCDVAVIDGTRLVYRGQTNPDGLFAGRAKGRLSGVVVAMRRGADWAVSLARNYYRPDKRYGRVYLHTDRPVYRPNQTVQIKLILRRHNLEEDTLEFEPNEELEITVQDSKRNPVQKSTVRVNEFGAADLSMALGDEPPLGRYRISARGTDAYGSGHFLVQEYRKPEFEVTVGCDRKHAVTGDKLKFAIGARYYFGEPVKNARVSYEISASRYRGYHPWWRHSAYDWFSEGYYRPWRRSARREVASGEGQLDAEGRLEITFDSQKLIEDEPHDYQITIRASVTDRSRRQIDGSQSLRVAWAGVQLGLRADRYCYRPGEKVVMSIRTANLDGKGISAAVALAVSRRARDDEYPPLLTETIETDANGDGTFSFVADQSGYYRIGASVTGARGRTATRTACLWVADRSWRSPYRFSGINIKTDKQMYEPGEKASVLITTGHANHPVLITFESQWIEAFRLARFNGSLLMYEQRIEKSFSPAISLTATLFAEGDLVSQRQRLVVPPTDRWLNIEITTDQPQYEPGQDAAYTLCLTDHAGQPVSAELSFGLVDEAIYAIEPDKSPDIRKFYHGRRRRRVYTRNSLQFYSMSLGPGSPDMKVAQKYCKYVSKRVDGLSIPVPKDSEEREPRLRKEFPDSAVWRPAVRTDESGKATVSFTMPDSLTTWRAKVVAITLEGLVGQQTHQVVTRQNLMVRLECPRTFTERDQVTISAVVHNYLSRDKRCAVTLKTDGGSLESRDSTREIAIPAGADERVDWLLNVSTHKPVTLTVSALTDEESDAMQLTVPVTPHGVKLVEAEAGAVDQTARVVFTLPAEADREKSVLRVSLSPSRSATMVESLEYLVGYPYGCVEQTMSRFLPCIAVAQALQKLGVRNAKLEENLPKYVRRGLQRLYGFQHPDGSWGWWKHDQTNGFMSAYVVYGLAKAREADFTVSETALENGVTFLGKAIPRESDLDMRAYLTFAYSQVKPPEARWQDDLYGQRHSLSDYGAALLLLTTDKRGPAERVPELVKLLGRRAIVTKTMCHWGGKGGDYHWQRNQIQATSLAIQGLVAARPHHPLLGKAASWLALQRRGNYWRSTKDTAAAIFALADHMAATGELRPDYEASLSVNGRHVHTFRVAGNALELEPTVFEFSCDQLRYGENVIELSRDGKGSLYHSCSLDYYTDREDVPPSNAGLSVKREYFRLITKPEPGRKLYERDPLTGEIQSGQEIVVRLTVRAEQHCRYFMLEDYLPAGCEIDVHKSVIGNPYSPCVGTATTERPATRKWCSSALTSRPGSIPSATSSAPRPPASSTSCPPKPASCTSRTYEAPRRRTGSPSWSAIRRLRVRDREPAPGRRALRSWTLLSPGQSAATHGASPRSGAERLQLPTAPGVWRLQLRTAAAERPRPPGGLCSPDASDIMSGASPSGLGGVCPCHLATWR